MSTSRRFSCGRALDPSLFLDPLLTPPEPPLHPTPAAQARMARRSSRRCAGSLGKARRASALTHSADSRGAGGVRVWGHGPDRMRDRECVGPAALGRDSGGPEPSAQACGARARGARLGRARSGAAGRGRGGRQPPHGLALAAAVRGNRRRGPAAGQDPHTRHPARSGRRGGPGRDPDLRAAAARGDALDRAGDGEGDRHLAALGAAHLAGAPTSAASHPHLQALA